jgi:hypothetical protein
MSDRERGGIEGWVDSQIKTSHGVPDLRGCHCKRVRSIDFSNVCVWLRKRTHGYSAHLEWNRGNRPSLWEISGIGNEGVLVGLRQ